MCMAGCAMFEMGHKIPHISILPLPGPIQDCGFPQLNPTDQAAGICVLDLVSVPWLILRVWWTVFSLFLLGSEVAPGSREPRSSWLVGGLALPLRVTLINTFWSHERMFSLGQIDRLWGFCFLLQHGLATYSSWAEPGPQKWQNWSSLSPSPRYAMLLLPSASLPSHLEQTLLTLSLLSSLPDTGAAYCM